MIVKQIPQDGRHFDIFDGDKIVASIMDDERLARQFAASDAALNVCKMIIEAERQANEERNYEMMVDVLEAAEAVVARVEG